MMITDEVRGYIGLATETAFTSDAVEAGAVRRFAHAIMDGDPAYGIACEANARFGGPIAPPLFPNHMQRRAYESPDPIQENANNPEFEGVAPMPGLPAIEPLKHLAILNGGSEFEFIRHARHGERVTVRTRYANITEKQTSKGAMVLVVRESEFRTGDGELLMRARMTSIRR